MNTSILDYFKQNSTPSLQLDIAEMITREKIQNEKYGVSAPVFLEGWEFNQGDASDEEMLEYAKAMSIDVEQDDNDDYDFSEVLGTMDEDFEEQLEKDIIEYFGSEEKAFEGIAKDADLISNTWDK